MMVGVEEPKQPIEVQIPGFTIEGIVGQGGFAVVYRAKRDADGTAWALKLARRRTDPRLIREGQLLRYLSGRASAERPAAPTFLAMGTAASGAPYVLMEFVDGDSLAQWIWPAGPATDADADAAVVHVIAVCHALEQIHRAGVVHRDLKPEHVRFRRVHDGRDRAGGPPGGPPAADASGTAAVIVDFGLAYRRAKADEAATAANMDGTHTAALTAHGERVGTDAYMAPELWRAQGDAGVPTDIYALGVILFELLTGRPPYVGDAAAVNHGHLAARIPRPSEFNPRAMRFDAAVVRALAKDARGRYQSALDMADALSRAMAESPQAAEATQKTKTPTKTPAQPPALRRPETEPNTPASSRQAGEASDAPIALVAVTTAVSATAVRAAAEANTAVVAKVVGTCFVLAFPWASSAAAGMRAALAFVADAGLGVRACVLDVGPVRVRRSARGLRISGKALARAAALCRQVDDSLTPAETAPVLPSVLFSGEAAQIARMADIAQLRGHSAAEESAAVTRWPTGLVPITGHGGAVADGGDNGASGDGVEYGPRQPARMHGRDDVLTALIGEADACIASGQVLLSTVIGDTGLGKSRLMHTLHHRLRQRMGDGVIYIEAGASARQLLRGGLGVDSIGSVDMAAEASSSAAEATPNLDDLDRACAQLDLRPHRAARWAAAFVLGCARDSHPEVAAVLNAPGVLRQAGARMLADALLARARCGPTMVIVDDAHIADPMTLDAIEAATAATDVATSASLGVWVAGKASLLTARPHWGTRAQRACRHTLMPLDEAAAQDLLRELLYPVEYVRKEVVAQISALAGGSPLYLLLLAQAIWRSGAVRPYPGGRGYYVAAERVQRALDAAVTVSSSSSLSPLDLGSNSQPSMEGEALGQAASQSPSQSPSGRSIHGSLATAALAATPAPFRPLLSLCALLGDGFTAADIRALQTQLWQGDRDDPLAAVDVDVGLERLRRAGLIGHSTAVDVTGAGERFGANGRFGRLDPGEPLLAVIPPLMRRALTALIAPERARRLHTAVLAYGERVGGWSPARLALHAAQAGANTQAARLYLNQAAMAHRRHLYAEAEHNYTLALEHGGRHGELQQAALAGRGSVRYRMQRLGDALEDLEKARTLIERNGADSAAEVARLLLEEATVLDWADEPARAAEVVDRADPLIAALAADSARTTTELPALRAQLALARGRVYYRQERVDGALQHLEQAVE